MKIPKSFKLFATKIEVVLDDKETNNRNILGESALFKSQILVGTKIRGDKVDEGAMMDTFYHEKVHMILDSMGKHELSKDEEFVEIFSRLLRQSEETSKY